MLEYIDSMFPLLLNPSEQQVKNIMRMKEGMKARYFDAPDLQHIGKNAYRFINAVSDFATHAKPLRTRSGYRENLFARTVWSDSSRRIRRKNGIVVKMRVSV